MDLDEYIDASSTPEPEPLAALRDHTWRHRLYPRMCTAHGRGRLLRILAQLSGARRALEIGTFTGLSALCLAEGMTAPDACLHTIEIDDESEGPIRRWLARSPHGSKVTLHIADALEIIPRLDIQLWDLVYIDGNKRHYPDYLALLLPRLRPGGLLLADNTLWGDKLLHAAAHPDERVDAQTAGILAFNRALATDPRIDVATILPGDDGLTIAIRR